MRSFRTLLGVVVAVVAAAVTATLAGPIDEAAADCAGPMIEFDPSEAARGTEILVWGTGWGTNCYDTGPPPQGQGVLGHR